MTKSMILSINISENVDRRVLNNIFADVSDHILNSIKYSGGYIDNNKPFKDRILSFGRTVDIEIITE